MGWVEYFDDSLYRMLQTISILKNIIFLYIRCFIGLLKYLNSYVLLKIEDLCCRRKIGGMETGKELSLKALYEIYE